jgi:AcrR family transcriptional regulator
MTTSSVDASQQRLPAARCFFGLRALAGMRVRRARGRISPWFRIYQANNNSAAMAPTRKRAAAPAARRRLSPEEREQQIVEGAIELFAEVGFGGQTRELSRRLGITQPLLYRYFPSKQDLIERVYREAFLGKWKPQWEALLADRTRPLRERLVAFYREYTEVIFTPQWIRLYLHAGLLGIGYNRRYIVRLEERLLRPICVEMRASLGMDAAPDAVTPEELELVWMFHAGIFYYGVRRFVYRMATRLEAERMIEVAVDGMLSGVPRALVQHVHPRQDVREAARSCLSRVIPKDLAMAIEAPAPPRRRSR